MNVTPLALTAWRSHGALGRELGGTYRVLVDANQHVDREAAARSGVGGTALRSSAKQKK